MKFSVAVREAGWNRAQATTVTLRPDLLRLLGLAPGSHLTAVVERGVLIVCRAEDAEVWEALLSDFPAALVGQANIKPTRHRHVLTRQIRGY